MLKRVVDVLEEAAGLARRHFAATPSASHKVDADDNPVTAADVEIAELLRKQLRALAPDAAWRCEEHQDSEARFPSGYAWIVDPLEGTKEFTRRIPEFGISVALVRNGKPVLAAVTNPVTREAAYWSASTGVDFRPAAALQTAVPADVGGAVANVSRTEFNKGSLAPFAGRLAMKPLGSVAYKLLRVANGREHLYFSLEPKSEWDICGGVGLIGAAGLEYRRFDGQPMRFGGANSRIRSGAVAGPGRLVDDFMRRFEREIAHCQALIASGAVR
jgi:myo-inositol-1(or 4)-monophosphatase